jgi:hypothetical protein
MMTTPNETPEYQTVSAGLARIFKCHQREGRVETRGISVPLDDFSVREAVDVLHKVVERNGGLDALSGYTYEEKDCIGNFTYYVNEGSSVTSGSPWQSN